MTEFSCVVLAAGAGTRFGGKKQDLLIDGQPLWQIVKEKAMECSNDVIVVGVDIPGGAFRKDSVYSGIRYVKHERVVILEAARPFVTVEQICRIGDVPAPSATYYMPSVETVLFAGMYLDRKGCTLLQTPQAFETKMLLEAHECIRNMDATDDTCLIKTCFGIEPVFLEGGPNLHKITYRDDVKLMKGAIWPSH